MCSDAHSITLIFNYNYNSYNNFYLALRMKLHCVSCFLQANYFQSAFYDSTMYIAQAYNQTQAAGGNLSDGVAIAQTFWNGTFNGA